MSTMVPMPVRVKPPPADSGDTISPGCAALAITTPANGARTTVLSTPIAGDGQAAARHLRVALRGGDLRAQGVALGHGLFELRARDQLLADQRAEPRGIRLGLLQLRLGADDLALRGGLQLRRGEIALGIGIDRIQRGHHLAGLDPLAFFDQHLAHAAGDLRRHGGHPSRHHVAAGIQYRGVAGAAGERYRTGRLHLHCAVAAEQEPATRAQHDRRGHAQADPQALA
jgi:hypothetical protein